MKATRVPANHKRVVEGLLANAERDAPLSVRGPSSTLAGTIYVDRTKAPTACTTCNKKGALMASMARGDCECSHVDCPNRKRITAAPRQEPT